MFASLQSHVNRILNLATRGWRNLFVADLGILPIELQLPVRFSSSTAWSSTIWFILVPTGATFKHFVVILFNHLTFSSKTNWQKSHQQLVCFYKSGFQKTLPPVNATYQVNAGCWRFIIPEVTDIRTKGVRGKPSYQAGWVTGYPKKNGETVNSGKKQLTWKWPVCHRLQEMKRLMILWENITRMLMIDVLMAIRGVFADFLSLVPFCSWVVLKGRRPFRWHSPRLWVVFNQSKKSWMAHHKTTNSHRPQCSIRWTTSLFKFLYYKLSFNYELFFCHYSISHQLEPFFPGWTAGLMYWTKVQRIPTKWWKDFPHHKNDVFQECATLQKTNGWNLQKNAGLEDDLPFFSTILFFGKSSRPIQSLFHEFFGLLQSLGVLLTERRDVFFQAPEMHTLGKPRVFGHWGCRSFTLWLKIRRWKPSSTYRIWNHFFQKCFHWKQGK